MKLVDRSIRSLIGLNGASTSRVLNLATVERSHGKDVDYQNNPLFRSKIINTSIILKHRLRADEDYVFTKNKTTATKIILPFDKADLKSGGRSFFVDQSGFADNLFAIGGYKSVDGDFERDIKVLRLIEPLPSLDPFILREYIARHEINVAGCYFNISNADQTRMKEYVTEQVRNLSQLATGEANANDDLATPRLAMSLLSNSIDQRLEPLRKAFGLNEDDFREGAFAWRGFLYYKWRMETLVIDSMRVLSQIAFTRPVGRISQEQRNFISEAKSRISEGVTSTIENVKGVFGRYDTVYATLVTDRNPKAFCDFLLAAPPLFKQLGEMIGTIEHVVSYWKYRFPEEAPLAADAFELEDIFYDFVQGFPKSTVPVRVAV